MPLPLTGQAGSDSPGEHEEQADEVDQEEFVVLEADAGVDPWAVVVEPGHAAVT